MTDRPSIEQQLAETIRLARINASSDEIAAAIIAAVNDGTIDPIVPTVTAPHALTMTQIMPGAGYAVCSCGWRSRPSETESEPLDAWRVHHALEASDD